VAYLLRRGYSSRMDWRLPPGSQAEGRVVVERLSRRKRGKIREEKLGDGSMNVVEKCCTRRVYEVVWMMQNEI